MPRAGQLREEGATLVRRQHHGKALGALGMDDIAQPGQLTSQDLPLSRDRVSGR